MVQTADLRNGDHLAAGRWMHRARIGTVLPQEQMRSGSVIVFLVRREGATQMALVEDNEVVQTFAPDRAMARSTYGFCHGERGAVRTSLMSIASTRLLNTGP